MLPPVQPFNLIYGGPTQEISNPTVYSLAICFQKDFEQNYSLLKISSPGSLCKDILYALISRGELTDIDVPATGIRLRQIDDTVIISFEGESPDIRLDNMTPGTIQNNLINNMIVNDKRCFFLLRPSTFF